MKDHKYFSLSLQLKSPEEKMSYVIEKKVRK